MLGKRWTGTCFENMERPGDVATAIVKCSSWQTFMLVRVVTAEWSRAPLDSCAELFSDQKNDGNTSGTGKGGAVSQWQQGHGANSRKEAEAAEAKPQAKGRGRVLSESSRKQIRPLRAWHSPPGSSSALALETQPRTLSVCTLTLGRTTTNTTQFNYRLSSSLRLLSTITVDSRSLPSAVSVANSLFLVELSLPSHPEPPDHDPLTAIPELYLTHATLYAFLPDSRTPPT